MKPASAALFRLLLFLLRFNMEHGAFMPLRIVEAYIGFDEFVPTADLRAWGNKPLSVLNFVLLQDFPKA